MVRRLFLLVAALAAVALLGVAAAPAALAVGADNKPTTEPEWCFRTATKDNQCRWTGTAWTMDESPWVARFGFLVAAALTVGTVAGAAKAVKYHRTQHDPVVVLERARQTAVDQAQAARRMRDAGSLSPEQYHRRLDQIIDSVSTLRGSTPTN